MQSFNFTKPEWGSGTWAPPASWGLFASAPAGGARTQLKGAAGSGWPQWRSAAVVRGQERSPRGAAAPLAQDIGRPATGTRRHCSALPSFRPSPCPRSVPAHSGLPMAPEARASPRLLLRAALLLLAALLPVASSAGPSGTRTPDSVVGSAILFSAHLLAILGTTVPL